MELIVEGRGTFLGKHQGRLRVTRDKKRLRKYPLSISNRYLLLIVG